MIKRFWLGAALLTLFLSLTAHAFYEKRIIDSGIYMACTVFALVLAYALSDYS